MQPVLDDPAFLGGSICCCFSWSWPGVGEGGERGVGRKPLAILALFVKACRNLWIQPMESIYHFGFGLSSHIK